ncbi:ATP-grasp domain-containing protein [Candidatus Pantoea multigeneris]|uniref:Carbamoyl-phosphate synthase large chain n=1 Tax=Candidatus Pantoea multigeneris TaxID=2608357 RepID=A0ABX0RCI0_9GAMM|nr:ATP-grasp domain-containing protein [Pantoea multigeneris]NIF23062.1 carbamoyl-phosphate synthase large chain [Pantoea multigeneris]
MRHNIWFMEGLSSQRDIIHHIKNDLNVQQRNITVYASHRYQRNEILSLADAAFIEPENDNQRLEFILSTQEKYAIQAIHTGRHAQWFESHRKAIEACGVRLTTGASNRDQLALADDKAAFAEAMQHLSLPVVPSIRVDSAAALREQIASQPFAGAPLCIKPVNGIYGMGFWQFDDSLSPMAAFTHPDHRRVNTALYLQALEATDTFSPLVLMPYLPGPEYSVDILAEKGQVLAAIARRKEGALQHLEKDGAAYELAVACASAMGADGLVNVQTRHDAQGQPRLLEINMRPSGGIGYTALSGVNLPALFALHQLDLIDRSQILAATQRFHATSVRALTQAVSYSSALTNRLI